MLKKFTTFALFLAVIGLFAAVSVDAQRLITRTITKSGSALSTSPEPTVDALDPEANPAVNLDQCRNGGVTSAPVNCGAGWANGNAGAQNSHYTEGGSINYRAIFTNLTVGSPYTVTFEYDTWYSNPNNHAIDYLTSYNTATTNWSVNPCYGVNDGGACGNSAAVNAPAFTSQFPIPDDPCITKENDDAAYPYQWTGWGMTLTGSAILTACADAPTNTVQEEKIQITVSFTATQATAVLGWSGHIASQADWGAGNSATAINGSSYHMRVAGNTGWGGQQDRSLSTAAILVPSAAGATVSGRVTDRYGRAISYARMTIYNGSTGEFDMVYTNTFGYYKFEDLPVNDLYLLSVYHSRYTFLTGSVSFTLDDNISNLDFQATR